MKRRYQFLRFVVWALRVIAVILAIAALVGAIFFFRLGAGGEGALADLLRWLGRGGGFIALICGVFYFIIFWGLADLVSVQLVTEENTRILASRLDAVEGKFSVKEISAAAAAEVTKALETKKALEAKVVTAETVVVEGAPTVEDVVADAARLRAKETLDKALEDAARQMAELEAAAPPVEAARLVHPVSAAVAEDDLAEIVGIGPVFRVRLREAGIITFAQLAAASPEELAAITEQAVDRITHDDWIGQARKLAGK